MRKEVWGAWVVVVGWGGGGVLPPGVKVCGTGETRLES